MQREYGKEWPTLFGVCDHVLKEDVTGSDYRGTNTVELVNCLSPGCPTLSNRKR